MSSYVTTLLDNALFHNRHRDDPFAIFFSRETAPTPGHNAILLAAFYQAYGGAASTHRGHVIDC